MISIPEKLDINWRCKHTWKTSSYNTMWCLIGCSIGDFGTIAYFQFTGINWPVFAIMTLAIINGLITSIILETLILARQMQLKMAFQTAIGMSLISMISMVWGPELPGMQDLALRVPPAVTWLAVYRWLHIAPKSRSLYG